MVWYQPTGGTASGVWVKWTTNSTSATSASTYDVWPMWAQTGTASTTANTVWVEWQTNTGQRIPVPVQTYYQPPQLSAEERARIAEEQRVASERYAQEQAERQAKRKEAVKTATRLLVKHLTREQRREFKKEKAFHVISETGKRFKVKLGRQGNVLELDAEGKPANRFCIHPYEDVPDHDTVLAQKLMLETDEAAFRRIANRTALAV